MKKNDNTGCDGDVQERVLLNVGGFFYTTTRSVLLSSHHEEEEKGTFFNSLLSDRWQKKLKTSSGDGISHKTFNSRFDLPDRDGDIFFYILYYLREGQIPRGVKEDTPYDTLLSAHQVKQLEEEAAFYGLTGLAEICHTQQDLLRGFKGSPGDLDVTQYHNFKWYIDCEYCTVSADYEGYRLNYQCENTAVRVRVHKRLLMGASPNEVSLTGSTREGAETTYVDNKTFVARFRLLQNTIEKLCGDSGNEKVGYPTVSEVLANVPTESFPVETRLWWAMEVSELLKFYKNNRNWNFEFGAKDKDLIKFLCHDREWKDE